MSPISGSGKTARPPSEVRFIDLHVEPWPDGQKVRVHIELTPFSEPPSLELSILDRDGRNISSASIIESATRKLVLTMHLRGAAPAGPFNLAAKIVYQDVEAVDQKTVDFDLPAQA